jgi:hypothetical protein
MKKILTILFIIPLFLGAGCAPQSPAPTSTIPPQESVPVAEEPATTTETPTPIPAETPPPAEVPAKTETPLTPAPSASNFKFVTGDNFYAQNLPVMPAKGAAIFDPIFHTAIVRVTDKKTDGYTGPGIENEYARSDPENSDGTRLVLRGNDGEWYLYSALDYKPLKHLEITGGGQEPEPRWDAQNPKIFYYLSGMELRAYNIDTNVSTAIRDFGSDFKGATIITTKTEGDASVDRKLWCLMAQNEADDKTLAVFAYDKSQKKILGKKTNFPDPINWVSADMSGKHCVIGYDEHIAESYSPDFSRKVQLPDKANGHMDLALTAAGRDAMIYQNNATDFIAMADLDSGAETPLVSVPFDINGDIGLHFSGNAAATPGWALISTYGSKGLPPENSRHSWMDNQLFMVELKANPRIWRLAETRAFTSRDFSGEKNYFAEAFASINTRGTRVYFGSNWANFSTEYSETYAVILPTDWQKYIP